MRETIEKIKQLAYNDWKSEKDAEKIEDFLNCKLEEYSKLGFTKEEILGTWEKKRNYNVRNFYQEAKFPSLDKIAVYETEGEARKIINPSKGFRCPSCKGVSQDPYTCNTKLKREDGSECDWKSWGFLGTLGTGHRFLIKESFLEHGLVDEIFMPISLETK